MARADRALSSQVYEARPALQQTLAAPVGLAAILAC